MVRRLALATGAAALLAFAAYAGWQVLTGDAVQPLLKAEGWRAELDWPPPPPPTPFAVLEIAFDRATATQAWEDNVAAGLPERSGAPDEPGIYGDLANVDFDTQAVVVWSSGESSTCPEWLADVDVDDAGTVVATRDDTAGRFGACTDDYNPYRMLVAVDRDRLPDPAELPTEDVSGIPSGLVAAYPAEQWED